MLPIQRLTSALKKHTICVLPIKRLTSARRKHTIRVLLIQRLTSATLRSNPGTLTRRGGSHERRPMTATTTTIMRTSIIGLGMSMTKIVRTNDLLLSFRTIGMLLVMCNNVLNLLCNYVLKTQDYMRGIRMLCIKCTVGLYEGNPNALYTVDALDDL